MARKPTIDDVDDIDDEDGTLEEESENEGDLTLTIEDAPRAEDERANLGLEESETEPRVDDLDARDTSDDAETRRGSTPDSPSDRLNLF